MRINDLAIAGTLGGLVVLVGAIFAQVNHVRNFTEDAYRVALPRDWTGGLASDKESWTYHSRREDEYLTVSIIGWGEPTDSEQRRSVFVTLVNLRHAAETKMPDGPKGVKVTDPHFADVHGMLAARYSGSDAAGRQFRCLLLGGSRAVTIFYYESLRLSSTEADARARPIFNSITLPK